MKVNVSESATKVRKGLPKGAVAYFAKTRVKVEDDKHESDIAKGEKFHLYESRGKHFLFDTEDDAFYKFQIDKRTFDRLTKKHTPIVAREPHSDEHYFNSSKVTLKEFEKVVKEFVDRYFKGEKITKRKQGNFTMFYVGKHEGHLGNFFANSGWIFTEKRVNNSLDFKKSQTSKPTASKPANKPVSKPASKPVRQVREAPPMEMPIGGVGVRKVPVYMAEHTVKHRMKLIITNGPLNKYEVILREGDKFYMHKGHKQTQIYIPKEQCGAWPKDQDAKVLRQKSSRKAPKRLTKDQMIAELYELQAGYKYRVDRAVYNDDIDIKNMTVGINNVNTARVKARLTLDKKGLWSGAGYKDLSRAEVLEKI